MRLSDWIRKKMATRQRAVRRVSPMSVHNRVLAGFLLCFLLLPVAVAAQEVSGEKVKIEITSCVVYSVRHSAIKYDCIAEARSALGTCDEPQSCEIPIGLNLTGGKDLDPDSGFLGKQVKLVYRCAGYAMQSGPYQQDDHASLVLDCSGMWW
jgi:hypothetical protein